MTSTSERAVVFIRLSGMDYVPAGLLRHEDRAYFFRYGRRYLGRPDAIPLDPARMPLADMEFSGRVLFSALRDAAPDRWGRKVLGLMAGRAPGTLSEFEVLTAAHHPQRMGALAFGPTPDGPASLAPWATGDAFCMVPEDLGRVAAIVARVDEVEDDEERDAVRSGMPEDAFLAALASSLSLGGARPKAMVSVDGTPWIAKFSKRGDPWREPVVEHTTMTLAARCGITVASTRLMELEGHFVLLAQRFDRQSGGSRHVISGFTVTGVEEDGDWGSYQNLAEQARRLGDADCGPEIFRRMAFNALCSNRDDHLRNHAFFVSRKAITMTPAYDLVPIFACGIGVLKHWTALPRRPPAVLRGRSCSVQIRLLARVKDPQNFDATVPDAVRQNVWVSGKDQFSGPGDTPRTTGLREMGQCRGSPPDFIVDFPGQFGVITCDMAHLGVKVSDRCP